MSERNRLIGAGVFMVGAVLMAFAGFGLGTLIALAAAWALIFQEATSGGK